MNALHITKDEHKFHCGRTNHHGVVLLSWEHYLETRGRHRYVCYACIDRAARAYRREHPDWQAREIAIERTKGETK